MRRTTPPFPLPRVPLNAFVNGPVPMTVATPVNGFTVYNRIELPSA